MRRLVGLALVVSAAMTVIPVTGVGAAGDICVRRGDRGHPDVQSGLATCSANENSIAVAQGAYSNATAVGDSEARSQSDGDAFLDAANAWVSSTAIVRNGGTASASFNSTATATNGVGNCGPTCNLKTIANALNSATARADGVGSKAYADGGSTAIATNGGCAEAWDGTTAIADGPGEVVVTGRATPRFCPSP
jgi:hypothetical protein